MQWLEGKRLTQCGGWGGKLFLDVLAMGEMLEEGEGC